MSDAECAKCGQSPKFKCERCLQPYCSSECQVADWQEHKGICYKFPNLIPMHILKATNTISVKSDTLSKRSHGGSSVNLNESRRSNTSTYHQRSNNPIEQMETASLGGAKPKRVLDDKDFALMPKNNIQLSPSQSVAACSTLTSPVLTTPDKNSLKWRMPYPPPSDFFEAIVQFVEEFQFSKRFVWVTDAKYDSPLQKLMSEINRSINQAEPCSPDAIVPGALVAAPLNKILYRAEVLNTSEAVQRANIRLVDYGNEMRIPYSQIFAPIPIMTNLNAYAVRVCVPNTCGPLELESILTIRVVGEKPSEGYYNVECKTKTIPLDFDVESLTKEESLTVVKSFSDGRNALLRLSASKELDMDVVLNSAQTLQYDFENAPTEGTFVAARTGYGWKRACLLGTYSKEHQFLVYTIDEGFIGLSPQIKRIPEIFVGQPMRVFAISASSADYMLCESMLETAKKLSLKLLPTSVTAGKESKTHLSCALFDDTRKIVDVVKASVFTGRLDELGLKLWHDKIAEGSNVFISHVITYKEVYIASHHTKEYPIIVISECPKCTPFEATDSICKGDMVVVSVRAGTSYRGKIIFCENNSYKVMNVDRGSEEVVERKCLLKPTQLLRSLPVRCLLTKLMYLESIPTPTANNKALAALENCMKNDTEFFVTYANGSKQTVDLLFQTKERQSLCKKLLPMVFEPCDEPTESVAEKSQNELPKSFPLPEQTPLPPTPPGTPIVAHAPVSVKSHGPYTLDDLDIIPIACGEKSSLYVLDATTLLNLEGPYITAADYDNKQFLTKMEKYLSSVGIYCSGPTSPKGGYAPKKMEICLSVFAEDGEWYRALCIDHHPNETFVVMFLDYGNVAKVSKKDIMPITLELMFPSNANMVYVEDVTTKEHALKFAKATQENPIISAKISRLSQNDAYVAKVHRIEQLIG